MHFKNKVIWITGASSGIGAELARQFAAQGAKLVLTARNVDALKEVQKKCLEVTRFCEIVPADLTQAHLIDELITNAVNSFGRIDVVVHNAGVSQRSFAEDTTMDVYRHLMELHFFAPVAITKQLLPLFRQQGGGHIVAIGSMAGLMGFPMRTGYAAAKHALKGFFETLQVEHTIPGLGVTIVSPGRINTPISLSALTGDGKPHNKMDEGQLNGIPVQRCASLIIDGVISNKRHIVIAKAERFLWWLRMVAPPLYYSIARKKGLK